jgi:CubicO group peptidase (beta-lactamase class C family)
MSSLRSATSSRGFASASIALPTGVVEDRHGDTLPDDAYESTPQHVRRGLGGAAGEPGVDDGEASPRRVTSGCSTLPVVGQAYVAGPQGTWAGAAGLADVGTRAPMTADAGMRLESVSKVWTAALIPLLDQDGVLGVEDTVEQWLPGLVPDGDRITIRHLLTNSGGLIDDNDLYRSDAAFAGYGANMQDPHLRAPNTAAAARLAADPSLEVPPVVAGRTRRVPAAAVHAGHPAASLKHRLQPRRHDRRAGHRRRSGDAVGG